ncbi:MAG: MFS transporter [Anaerolineales bacterium]|nr:MFS transporter [Anaerolineales bacterium]
MTVRLPVQLRLDATFTALKYPNYRLWFTGQIVSLFGTWMQSTAQGFLVYELTQSPAFLGYVGFAAGLPSWLFMLYGGVVADRISRRNLLVITQSSMMILAFILSALTFTGAVRPWHIILLAFLLGVANAFDAPARLALAPELVAKEDLTNAIALNGTMFNTATIVGPTVGSLIYALFGAGWCFFLNGASFLAVIFALLRMKLPDLVNEARRSSSAISDIMEGFRYVLAQPVILALISLISAVSLFGSSFITLLPAWAVQVLSGDVKTNGLLNSARGVGALIGALSIASLGRFRYRGKLLTIGLFVFPIMLLIFSMISWFPLSLLVLTIVGASLVFVMNLANAMIQTNVSDNVRGRVTSIYSLTFFGFMPIGSLLIGQIAEQAGERPALQFGAVMLLLVAAATQMIYPKLRAVE